MKNYIVVGNNTELSLTKYYQIKGNSSKEAIKKLLGINIYKISGKRRRES